MFNPVHIASEHDYNKEIGKLGKKGEVLNSYNFINYLEKIKSN